MHFSGVQLRLHTLFISPTACFTGHRALREPDRIVYVSCDPATPARKLKLLTARGYALTHAEAFDLFPRCGHVETVVCSKKMIVDA